MPIVYTHFTASWVDWDSWSWETIEPCKSLVFSRRPFRLSVVCDWSRAEGTECDNAKQEEDILDWLLHKVRVVRPTLLITVLLLDVNDFGNDSTITRLPLLWLCFWYSLHQKKKREGRSRPLRSNCTVEYYRHNGPKPFQKVLWLLCPRGRSGHSRNQVGSPPVGSMLQTDVTEYKESQFFESLRIFRGDSGRSGRSVPTEKWCFSEECVQGSIEKASIEKVCPTHL